MIYNTEKGWKDANYNHALRTEGILLLDLSLIHQLTPYFQGLSQKTNIPAAKLMKQYEEIVADIGGIREYIHGIIVRLESFNEKVEKTVFRGLNMAKDQCMFDMLNNRYQGEMCIGIDIPIDKAHQFPPNYVQQDQLRNVKIFSVRVGLEDREKLEFIKKYKFSFPKQTIHINLKIKQPKDLIEFQRFLVVNEYPIEHIVLTTNLLGVLRSPPFAKEQTLGLDSSPNTIAYHHNRYLERFLNGALMNVCEYYEIPYQPALQYGDSDKDAELDPILKIFAQIHRRKHKLGDFKGGFVIPPTLLLPSLKKFSGGYEADLFIAAYVQRYAFTTIRLAMAGEFKTMKTTIVQ